jgi:hypothetical protein
MTARKHLSTQKVAKGKGFKLLKRVNPRLLRYLGWATFGAMTAAAVGMIITS